MWCDPSLPSLLAEHHVTSLKPLARSVEASFFFGLAFCQSGLCCAPIATSGNTHALGYQSLEASEQPASVTLMLQVDRAMEDEGWKLLLLCRLSPLIPYNVLNITMASTKIHFWPFAIVSFFGKLRLLALPVQSLHVTPYRSGCLPAMAGCALTFGC